MATNEQTGGIGTEVAQDRGRGWTVPIALGAGLLSVGGFFVLIAHGLSVLASITY